MATRGVAVEAILDSKQETVRIERCPSHDGSSTGSLPRAPAQGSDMDVSNVGSHKELSEVKERKVKRRGSKAHHEYINVGIRKETPPFPRKKHLSEKFAAENEQNVNDHDWEGAGIDHLLKHVKQLEKRNSLLEDTNKKLRKENQMLSIQLQEMQNKSAREAESMKQSGSSKEIIAKFSCLEVQSLLFEMGLPQYVTTFANERINGLIFLELDEVILEIELGVNSSLHRKRLMRVIRGSHHVSDVLSNSSLERTLV